MTCSYCFALKDWLDERGFDYDFIFVDHDPAAAAKMIELSGQQGVPFTTIEHPNGSMDKILGFDRAKISKVLGI
jgi:glutaredoxin